MSVPVPPDDVATALPFVLPQLALLGTMPGVAIADGSVIITDAVVVQLLLSLIVTMYVFAVKEVIELLSELVIELVPLLQLYVYGDAPPAIVTLAVPVLLPLHNSFTGVEFCTDGPLLLPIATVFVTEQPLASVTVKV